MRAGTAGWWRDYLAHENLGTKHGFNPLSMMIVLMDSGLSIEDNFELLLILEGPTDSRGFGPVSIIIFGTGNNE